jgi:hypothetical protein
MNSNFDNQTKERVRLALNIVDVIGGYSEVRRQGRNFVARCPFHDDRRPSMQINAERQSWKCWVCDVGGDVFSFVMQKEGMSFPEALQYLADKAGLSSVLDWVLRLSPGVGYRTGQQQARFPWTSWRALGFWLGVQATHVTIVFGIG